MSPKQKLIHDIELFCDPNEGNTCFILEVKIAGFPDNERVLNTKANMKEKLNYIISAYDNELRLNPKVQIVKWRKVYLPE